MKLEPKKSPDFKMKEEKYSTSKNTSLDAEVAACVSELLNAATSLHKLHLKITGTGSYASHKALNEIYDELPEFGDSLAEEYQGAAEILLIYKEAAPKTLNTKEEGLQYLRDLKLMIDTLQAKLPYSEIVNLLDEAKSAINSVKYKLLFLS